MSKYNEILGNISNIGQTVTQAGSTLSSLVSSDEESAITIRDTYLNGFFGETSIFSPSVFSRLFDEPTYLTFRIEFNFDNSAFENKTTFGMGGLTGAIGTLDVLPEPLLSLVDTKDASQIRSYSTYNYLKNALGEGQRANMLKLFVSALQDIQKNYPYYFQSVSGLGDLMKVTPTDGIRFKDGENVISIKCLESIDMKITQLMQLYKNIAWDDFYQRWILPDMMRFFNMKIYVSEIRLFHSSNISSSKSKSGIIFPFGSSDKVMNANSIDKLYDSSLLSSINKLMNVGSSISSRVFGTNSAVTQTLNSINQTVDTVNGLNTGVASAMYHLCNNAINDVMPTICFDCHMCEFDIEDTFAHINDLSASTKDTESPKPEIKIKVGKMFTKQVYPLNAQLTASEKGYSLNIKDSSTGSKDLIKGSYIDDEMLMEANYYKEQSTYEEVHTSELENAFNNAVLISNTSRRMNPNISNDEKLSYRPAKGGSELAALALAEGILGQTIKDAPRSLATEDDSLKQNAKQTDLSSNAMQRQIENAIKTNGKDAVDDALKMIASLRDTVYNSEDIRSASTDPVIQKALQDNAMRNVLEHIAKSEATTNANALKDVIDIILNDVKSTATSNQNSLKPFNDLN